MLINRRRAGEVELPMLVAVPPGRFEDLYRQEYPALIGVARALTGADHASEDLVQDTMVRAYLHWKKLARFESPGGWCVRVLTNACRSWWRRQATARRYLASTARAERTVASPSVEHVAFWQAVRQLPDRPRLAVVLFYVADRSVADIAEILGAPEGTIKSDLFRSRAVLMDALGGAS